MVRTYVSIYIYGLVYICSVRDVGSFLWLVEGDLVKMSVTVVGRLQKIPRMSYKSPKKRNLDQKINLIYKAYLLISEFLVESLKNNKNQQKRSLLL